MDLATRNEIGILTDILSVIPWRCGLGNPKGGILERAKFSLTFVLDCFVALDILNLKAFGVGLRYLSLTHMAFAKDPATIETFVLFFCCCFVF